MNTYEAFINFFRDVAARLTLLGNEPGKTNLFFIDTPEQANVLLGAIRNDLTLPCLCVEYFDEDPEENSGNFRIITAGFVVLAQANKKGKGQDVVRQVIYEQCKPAAEQIFAWMVKAADAGVLKVGGKSVFVAGSTSGSWVGPVYNDLYGWRLEFRWRVASGLCYSEEVWQQ